VDVADVENSVTLSSKFPERMTQYGKNLSTMSPSLVAKINLRVQLESCCSLVVMCLLRFECFLDDDDVKFTKSS
jgi:hypothetical protein